MPKGLFIKYTINKLLVPAINWSVELQDDIGNWAYSKKHYTF